MTSRLISAAFVSLGVLACTANAQLLATQTSGFYFPANVRDTDQGIYIRPTFFIGETFERVFPLLGSSEALTAADSGRRWRIDASNDTNFAGFASLLTDGVVQRVGASIHYGVTGGGVLFDESQMVFGAGVTGPDLQGHAIDYIDFTLNWLDVEEPYNAAGESEVGFNFTLSVYGPVELTPVPEPSTIAAGGVLFVLAGVTVLRRRRKAAVSQSCCPSAA